MMVYEKISLYSNSNIGSNFFSINRDTNEDSKLAGNASLWDFKSITRDLRFGSSGFSATPGGLYSDDGIFDDMGESIRFWSSTEGCNNCAWTRELLYHGGSIERSSSYKNCGISIRCIKD
jgi:uncharacterized protein (TIGR02145 family)